MHDRGIDYGLGDTNIDKATGIRYGVISQHEVLQAWADSSEPDYGDPACPKCGGPAQTPEYPHDPDTGELADREEYGILDHACGDLACDRCKLFFDNEHAFGEEALGFTYEEDGYAAICGQDGDIFVLKSPFYTRSQFCSPCAPGAGYLMNECPDGEKAYCFGHDWFEDNKAPYRMWRVSDDTEVLPESAA